MEASTYPEGYYCTETGSSSETCRTVAAACGDTSTYPESTTCTESGGFPWLIVGAIVALGVTGFMFKTKKACFAAKADKEGGAVENKKAVKQALKNVLAKNNIKESLV